MNQKLLSILTKYKKIILVGWWTGWHIQPIVSLVKHIKNTHKIIDFLWIWWCNSQEELFAREEKIEFKSIPTLKLTSTKSLKILLYPIVLIQWILEARRILKDEISNLQEGQKSSISLCVFSKWWPGSVAIGIAAYSLSISLYIHESDTIPGISNKILAKFADIIFLWIDYTKNSFDSKKCEVVGQILDPIFSNNSIHTSTLKTPITWKTEKPHILVICGSQGSQVIFEAIMEKFWGNSDYEWIISLWKLNRNLALEFEKIPNCQAIDWISQENIAYLIQDTNIAITRWSATTLAELTAFENKPQLIIIPLPHSAGNHQFYNAKEYEKIGYQILEQQNIKSIKNFISTTLKNSL